MSLQTAELRDTLLSAFDKHFAFLRRLGYAPPQVQVQYSKVFHQWIQVSSTNRVIKREITLSLSTHLPTGDSGSIAIHFNADPGSYHGDLLFANLYLEDTTGTAPDWRIDLSSTSAGLDGLLQKCAIQIQGHCMNLITGRDWEMGYYYPKD